MADTEKPEKMDRNERLAAKLRENLRRRKAKSRELQNDKPALSNPSSKS